MSGLADAIAENEAAIRNLTRPQLRMLAPVLRKAARDVEKIVRGYARTDTGSEAQRQRAALVQLQHATKMIEQRTARALNADTVAAGMRARKSGVRGLEKMVREGAKEHGRPQSLRLDMAAVVADSKRSLLSRSARTSAVFGARLSRDIRRDIAGGIIRGDSIEQIAAKVARKTLPITRDGIPKRASDVRNGMETTIDARKLVKRGFDFKANPEGHEHGPFGQGQGKADRGRDVMARGKQTDPVKIVVSPGGKYEITDGRHRLYAAYQLGVPVRIQWERGHPSMDGAAGVALEQKQIRELARKPFERAKKHAEMIVQTEVAHAYNAAQLDALRALEAEDEGWLKVWDSKNDSKVCPVCYGLHGEIAAVGQNFSNGAAHPPAHPRCRCNVVPWRYEYGPHKLVTHHDDDRDREVLKRDDDARPTPKPTPKPPDPEPEQKPKPKPERSKVAVPRGFDVTAKPDGETSLFDGKPTIREGIPTFKEAKKTPYRENAYVIRPSDLANVKITGIDTGGHLEGDTRTAGVLAAMKSGKGLPAVEIDVDKKGQYFIADGNHRVWAALRDGDRPILVRFRPVELEAKLDPIAHHIRDIANPKPSRAAARDEITADEHRAAGNKVTDRALASKPFRVVVVSKPTTGPLAGGKPNPQGLELSAHKTRANAEASVRRHAKYGYVSRIVRVTT